MPKQLTRSIKAFFNTLTTGNEKITCYHCGEKSKKSATLYINFDGAIRPVCCHGCASILNTVEELGIHEEYRANKIQIPNQ